MDVVKQGSTATSQATEQSTGAIKKAMEESVSVQKRALDDSAAQTKAAFDKAKASMGLNGTPAETAADTLQMGVESLIENQKALLDFAARPLRTASHRTRAVRTEHVIRVVRRQACCTPACAGKLVQPPRIRCAQAGEAMSQADAPKDRQDEQARQNKPYDPLEAFSRNARHLPGRHGEVHGGNGQYRRVRAGDRPGTRYLPDHDRPRQGSARSLHAAGAGADVAAFAHRRTESGGALYPTWKCGSTTWTPSWTSC